MYSACMLPMVLAMILIQTCFIIYYHTSVAGPLMTILWSYMMYDDQPVDEQQHPVDGQYGHNRHSVC